MPLERIHKRMIVKLLACDVEPKDVADRLRERCLLNVPADQLVHFHPDTSPALSDELTTLFYETRAEYRADKREAAATETAFVQVTNTSAFDDRSSLCIEKQGVALALFKTDEDFHAIDNTCTHRDGPLCEGMLDDHEVECPLHGARFDVTTGGATAGPAPDDVESYDVRVRGDDIEVKLPVT